MIRIAVLVLLASCPALHAAEQVVDFEAVVPLLADQKANRVPKWVEKDVTFALAWEPKKTKGNGLLGFFTHLESGRKGLVCAMATEPIPVRATFPKPVSSVDVSLWASTGTPAVLEAFDADGKLVDRSTLDSAPARKAPGEPTPTFTMTVKAGSIAYV